MIQVIKDSQWFTSLEQIYEYANKQGETYLAIGIKNSMDKGYDLRIDDSLSEILQLQSIITALKKRVRELEAQAYVTSENYTATSTELRIAELRNKELEAENEEQKCSDCGIVKEYYSRIKELEAALEKYQAFWEWSRLADKMTFDEYEWPKIKQALGGGE